MGRRFTAGGPTTVTEFLTVSGSVTTDNNAVATVTIVDTLFSNYSVVLTPLNDDISAYVSFFNGSALIIETTVPNEDVSYRIVSTRSS